jgi:2-methylaconitate cis-trans-isomerase PrpF
MPTDVSDATYAIVEDIRRVALAASGVPDAQLLPFQIAVARPSSYTTFDGKRDIRAEQFHVAARMLVGADRLMHKAFPGGGAVCAAVAARIEGSVVHSLAAPIRPETPVLIGHPSGVLSIESEVEPDADAWRVERVEFPRTARRLMDGTAYVREALLIGASDAV